MMQPIYDPSQELHQAIVNQNIARVEEIVTQNIDQQYFYNLNNESALKVATIKKDFKIYEILTSNGVRMGPHENLTEIYSSLSESERKKIRSINLKCNIGSRHGILIRNSYVSYDSANPHWELQFIERAFEILSGIPMMSVIMKVVEASKNFQIIFDFQRDSVIAMDPSADEQTKGLFYISGIIYIGARGLLDPHTEFEVLGTLAHMLCHFAINLVYRNCAKPYYKIDKHSKMEFKEIIVTCRMNREKEEIIDFVFNYAMCVQHAELIARVPHLVVLYSNQPEKMLKIRENFSNLLQFFEQKVLPEMEEAIPMIQMKVKQDEKLKDKIIRILVFVIILLVILLILSIIF